MEQGTELEANFAAVMQELSVEAAGTEDARIASGISVLISGIHALGQRLEVLEETVVLKFETAQFQKIEQQLAVIRETDSVNQKLFDSLHGELISYRDNFVRDALQKPVIRDLVTLFDDLSKIYAQTEESQLRANLEKVLHFVIEIFHRLEVTEVETVELADRALHKVVGTEKTDSPEENGRIVTRVKKGFLWQGKVFRPEEVVVRRFTAPTAAEGGA
ncbi:MAG: nucleotide exchange factor GrpE [Chthoniobacterales bacterium]